MDKVKDRLQKLYPISDITRNRDGVVNVIGWGCIPEHKVYYHTLLVSVCYVNGRIKYVSDCINNITYSVKGFNVENPRYNFVLYFDSCSSEYLLKKSLELFANPNIRS